MLRRMCSSQIIKFHVTHWTGCITTTVTQPQYWRRFATEPATTKESSTAVFTEKWRIIYQLPVIRLVSAFNRLKIYQAALTAFGTPLAFALGQAGQTSTQAVAVCAAIGISGLITLTLGSYVARNVIGLIYINENQDLLKLAYVDFWGRRVDAVIAIDDLLPSWEQERRPLFKFYQTICLRNDKCYYKLLQRFGVVTDPQLFLGLFGE